jgi:hypothetical protein
MNTPQPKPGNPTQDLSELIDDRWEYDNEADSQAAYQQSLRLTEHRRKRTDLIITRCFITASVVVVAAVLFAIITVH